MDIKHRNDLAKREEEAEAEAEAEEEDEKKKKGSQIKNQCTQNIPTLVRPYHAADPTVQLTGDQDGGQRWPGLCVLGGRQRPVQ